MQSGLNAGVIPVTSVLYALLVYNSTCFWNMAELSSSGTTIRVQES